MRDLDGLIAGLEPLTKKVLTQASNLKTIARVGIGIDNVDLDAAKELGIIVSNTPEGPTQAVAEMTVTALMALCRNLVPMNKALHGGEWPKRISPGLDGLNVLFIGLGRIGGRTKSLLEPFGINALVYDPYLDDNFDVGGRRVSLEEGLALADAISLHAAGSDVILGETEFELIKPGAILLNSARGQLIDEDALIKALDSEIIAGAWFDSFWEEPYKGKLLEYEQVLLTPHTSTYTVACRSSMEMTAVKNLLRDMGIVTNDD